MLDHVHGRHREPGAVDDAADVAVERHVVEPVLGGLGLARIFLGVVPQLAHVGTAEHRVVVEGHLAVERQQLAVLGHDERIDLHHRGVEVAECAVAAQQRDHRAADLVGVSPSPNAISRA